MVKHDQELTSCVAAIILSRQVVILDAIDFEKQLKGWSRKKKEALFEGNWDEIVRLSNFKQRDHASGGHASTGSA